MKFVSVSQLLGCPLFGSNTGPFTAPALIVSLVGVVGSGEEREKKKPPAGLNLAKHLLVFQDAAG